MTSEQLILELQKQIEKLEEELKQLKVDTAFFEEAANTWKKSYRELDTKYNIETENLKQVIEELELELRDSKSSF